MRLSAHTGCIPPFQGDSSNETVEEGLLEKVRDVAKKPVLSVEASFGVKPGYSVHCEWSDKHETSLVSSNQAAQHTNTSGDDAPARLDTYSEVLESQELKHVQRPVHSGRPSELINVLSSELYMAPTAEGPPALDGAEGSVQRVITWNTMRMAWKPQLGASQEQLRLWFQVKQRRRPKLFQDAWIFFEEPDSSRVAGIYGAAMMPLICLSVLVCLLQSLDEPVLHGVAAAATETTCDALFALELLLRFVVCPSRREFSTDLLNLNDFLSTVPPLIIRACIGFVLERARDYETVTWSLLLGAVPLLRLLRLLRRFQKFRLLLSAFRIAFEALPVLLFIYTLIGLGFAALFFLVEPRSNLASLPQSLWLTVITMTTTGYGDKTATTSAGKVITGVLIITTTLYSAVPLGIIGDTFREVWSNRDGILLVQQTRRRLIENSYMAHDLQKVFDLFDSHQGGSLAWHEFADMLNEMNLGFTEKRSLELFQLFDTNAEGSISKKKFVFTLFPEAKELLYKKARAREFAES